MLVSGSASASYTNEPNKGHVLSRIVLESPFFKGLYVKLAGCIRIRCFVSDEKATLLVMLYCQFRPYIFAIIPDRHPNTW